MRKLYVDLPQNGYDIFIGDGLEESLMQYLSGASLSAKVLIVSDTNVGKLYKDKLIGVLEKAGLSPAYCSIPAGEMAKSLAQAEHLYTRAVEAGLDRRSAIFALGGGVIGDLAGFVAATYMRGIAFFQVPTSLLAQVDSSVGGKVAINHSAGKNLIGAFYQPRGVFIDLTLLDSLPPRELYTGLGEIVKYGVIYDEDFFRYLEDHVDQILSRDHEAMQHLVFRSCEIKAEVVSQDEKEAGLRQILNFGHTLGHAIEKETGYARYNHGEAVAVGMMGAAYISADLGLTDEAAVERLRSLLTRLHLPIVVGGCTVDNIYADIFHDKKTLGGKVTWLLMDKIGHVLPRSDVPEEIVKKAIVRILSL